MARLFTLTFPFKEKSYEAEIMVDDASAKDSISVYLPDASLHGFLKDGRAVIPLKINGSALPDATTPDEQLKQNIISAFKAYESQDPPESIW